MARAFMVGRVVIWATLVYIIVYLATAEARWLHLKGARLLLTDNPFMDLALLYVLMAVVITLWGASLMWRLGATQIRTLLLVQVGVLLMWVAFKVLKLSVPFGAPERLLWYLYYLVTLSSATIAVLIANRVNPILRDSKRILEITVACISAIFFLLVITNDWHRLVFSFPEGIHIYLTRRGATWLQGVIVAWQLLCLCYASAMTLFGAQKRRIRSFQIGFVLVVIAMIGYSVLYARDLWILRDTETVAITCMLIVGSWEMAIASGLIPANRGYLEAIERTTLPIFLTDRDGQIQEASPSAMFLGLENLGEVIASPTLRLRKTIAEDGALKDALPGKTLRNLGEPEKVMEFQAVPIDSGFAVSVSDVSAMVGLGASLEEAREVKRTQHEFLQRQQQAGTAVRMVQFRQDMRLDLEEFLAQNLEVAQALAHELPEARHSSRHHVLRRLKVELSFVQVQAMILPETGESQGIGVDVVAAYLAKCCQDFSDERSVAQVHCTQTQQIPAAQAMKMLFFYHRLFAYGLGLSDVDIMIHVKVEGGQLVAESLWDFAHPKEGLFDDLVAEPEFQDLASGFTYHIHWEDPSFFITFKGGEVHV
ncbi:MAG: hypothetical protein Q4G30_01475 [Actinomycetaceae bacterium]|nr:hypothetical protein [Actinomycetaceae bacterium]